MLPVECPLVRRRRGFAVCTRPYSIALIALGGIFVAVVVGGDVGGALGEKKSSSSKSRYVCF
jgi:hypothetical protein